MSGRPRHHYLATALAGLATFAVLAGVPGTSHATPAPSDVRVADLGPPPEHAGTHGGLVGVKAGACSGSSSGTAKVIKEKVGLRTDYYSAAPVIVYLEFGRTLPYYSKTTNTHGNVWREVQYSTIQNDWCGWLSDNWVEIQSS